MHSSFKPLCTSFNDTSRFYEDNNTSLFKLGRCWLVLISVLLGMSWKQQYTKAPLPRPL
jgi:hypothetical protein